jgi:hypothetical protein
MWAFIISLIYEQSCEKYLADMLKHQCINTGGPKRCRWRKGGIASA